LIARNRSRLFVGSPATVMAKLRPMITASQADELMIITAVRRRRRRPYPPLEGSRRAKLALWVDANEMSGGVG
jgi:hypothetical protein